VFVFFLFLFYSPPGVFYVFCFSLIFLFFCLLLREIVIWINCVEKFNFHAGGTGYPVFDTKFAKSAVYICYRPALSPKEPAP